MISFRTRSPDSIDWTQVDISGEDEESAAWLFAARLGQTEWEVLVSRDAGEFGELEEFI